MHYHVGFATLLLAAFLFCAVSQRDCRVDRTLEEGATGEDVVIATVNKISDSGIFQDDHQFLRRMAYVETNFGDTMTPGSGGIWAVSENVFRVVTRVILLSHFPPYGELFRSSFGFKWNETVVIDNCLVNNICSRQKLDVPLYSALSVMVYIEALGHMIQDNIIQQAQLWKRRFRPFIDDAEDVFIERARILLNQLPPSLGEETVIATVHKIAGSGIFPNDFQFLKRMAYIETNYGQTATPGGGGIWAVSEDVFRIVTRVIVVGLPQLKPYGELFESSFGFKWNETVVTDDCLVENVCNRQQLDVPLYSALSVMVYIEVLGRMIEDNIIQQAQLWKRRFRPSIDVEVFIEKAYILLNQLPPSCTYLEGKETAIVTLNKIAGSGIFPNDFQFLKRTAYIATNYGQTATPGGGGIWAISMDMLRITTRYVLYHPQGQQLGKEIVREFSFNWTTTVVVDDCDAVCNITQMDVPLYSALAVMIYIRILDRTIQDDVIQQSLLWKRAFKTSYTNEQYFSDKVEEMKRAGAKYKGVDMIFVMDESGSIGAANFELLKNLAIDIIEKFEIGPNHTQVGWINFNHNARVVFNLNTYQDMVSLQAGIRAVTYSGGLTNISTGLLALNGMLSTGGRSIFDIPEVAIVVIHSQSDIVPIRNAAALLHRERNVEVFVIGVGSRIVLQQLNAVAEAGIASDISRNIFTLEGFNEEELVRLQETLRARACFSSIFSEVPFEQLNATSTVPEGAKAYVNTVCPEDGLTVNACGEDGAIFVYISRNPKAAVPIYDVIIQIDEGKCVSRFIECNEQI